MKISQNHGVQRQIIVPGNFNILMRNEYMHIIRKVHVYVFNKMVQYFSTGYYLSEEHEIFDFIEKNEKHFFPFKT